MKIWEIYNKLMHLDCFLINDKRCHDMHRSPLLNPITVCLYWKSILHVPLLHKMGIRELTRSAKTPANTFLYDIKLTCLDSLIQMKTKSLSNMLKVLCFSSCQETLEQDNSL